MAARRDYNHTSDIEEEKMTALASWKAKLKEATDFDNWGQPIEAQEMYTLVIQEIGSGIQWARFSFSSSDTIVLKKLVSAVEQRANALTSTTPSDAAAVDMPKMQDIAKAFSSWSEGDQLPAVAGLSISRLTSVTSASGASADDTVDDDNDLDDDVMQGGDVAGRGSVSLVSKPLFAIGKTLLCVTIQKIGLKDAPEHLDPFFSIVIKDTSGADHATAQRTPTAGVRGDLYLQFDVDVYFDLPVEEFTDDFAIFFELKHYKSKKKKISTKCFSILERDEIKEGEKALELYKKPVNYKRQKLKLLTVKPLFLCVNMRLTTAR